MKNIKNICSKLMDVKNRKALNLFDAHKVDNEKLQEISYPTCCCCFYEIGKSFKILITFNLVTFGKLFNLILKNFWGFMRWNSILTQKCSRKNLFHFLHPTNIYQISTRLGENVVESFDRKHFVIHNRSSTCRVRVFRNWSIAPFDCDWHFLRKLSWSIVENQNFPFD